MKCKLVCKSCLNIFYSRQIISLAMYVHARPGFVLDTRYLETVPVNNVKGINVDMCDMWLRYMMSEHHIGTSADILGVLTAYNCKSWQRLPSQKVAVFNHPPSFEKYPKCALNVSTAHNCLFMFADRTISIFREGHIAISIHKS